MQRRSKEGQLQLTNDTDRRSWNAIWERTTTLNNVIYSPITYFPWINCVHHTICLFLFTSSIKMARDNMSFRWELYHDTQGNKAINMLILNDNMRSNWVIWQIELQHTFGLYINKIKLDKLCSGSHCRVNGDSEEPLNFSKGFK